MARNQRNAMNRMQEDPGGHLEDVELIKDGPYDEKIGESTVEQHDIDQIPEIDITQDLLNESGERADNWLIYGNTYDGQRLVPTDDVNPENVDGFELEYEIQNPSEGGNYQGGPLLVHGDPPILYHSLGTDYVYAVNARTGEVLWSHDYDPYTGTDNNSAERGFAVYEDLLIKSTVDYGVLAINRYTGEDEWYFNGAHVYRDEPADGPVHEELDFAKTGPTSSHPPLVYNGTILKGMMGGEWGVKGWYDAIDLDGEPLWRAGLVPQDRWVGESWVHGGCTSWAASTLDDENDNVILSTGNPAPWYGTPRPGWNPFSGGKVALDVETGEYQWHYQDAPHDWWDYDSPSPAIVYDAEVDGEERRLVTWAPKAGWAYTVDAETGELIERSDELVQHHNMWTLPPKGEVDRAEPFLPTGTVGGINNEPGSYHPESRTVVYTGSNQPFALSWNETEYETGQMYTGINFGFVSGDDVNAWNGNDGVVAGVDPVTGDVKWQDWLGSGTRAGTVTTTSGVTFAGTGVGEFVAYDTETGERLWVDEPGGNLTGHPILWEDPGEEKHYALVGSEDGKLSVYSLEA